ncbi:MAG TPA: Rrf2 family transcriptional regulator [Gemmatimonadales bacterium]|jgi:Rrf2 family protein
MMTLPQTAEYAIRAVTHIASADGEQVRVEDIARALTVPRNYLSKTLHQLARAGILESTRGRGGGFRLAGPAAELTLADVVRPFGLTDQGRCVLGRPECRDQSPCAAHWRWKATAGQLSAFFSETTIADLLHPRPARPRTRKRRAVAAR